MSELSRQVDERNRAKAPVSLVQPAIELDTAWPTPGPVVTADTSGPPSQRLDSRAVSRLLHLQRVLGNAVVARFLSAVPLADQAVQRAPGPATPAAKAKVKAITTQEAMGFFQYYDADVYDAVKSHPKLWTDNQAFVIRTATDPASKHKHRWMLQFRVTELDKGTLAVFGDEEVSVQAGVHVHLNAITVNSHQLMLTKEDDRYRFLEVLTHELTHAILFANKTVKTNNTPETARNFDNLLKLAGTSTVNELTDFDQTLSKTVGQAFDVAMTAKVSNGVPAQLFADLHEFIIQEKFAIQESGRRISQLAPGLSSQRSNTEIAKNYSGTVIKRYETAIMKVAGDRKAAEKPGSAEKLRDHIDDAKQPVAAAMARVYSALDSASKP